MKFYKKQIFFFFITAIILQFQCCSHAGYEVIRAKTIVNENLEEVIKEDDLIPEFNDFEVPEATQRETVADKIGKKLQNLKFRKKKEIIDDLYDEEIIEEEVEDTDSKDIKQEIVDKAPLETQTIEPVDDKNKFQINAHKITYNDNDGNIYADGNVEIISKSQDVILKADNAILDKESQTLKLQNNVRIIKGGVEMKGEYLLVDLNEQNILMDNPTLEAYSFVIKAQEGFLIANDIQMLNGTVKCAKDTEFPFQTRGFMRLNQVPQQYLVERQKENVIDSGENTQSYTLNAKEIILTSYKDHNSFALKKADLYFNNKKILNNADLEILSDRSNQVHEISFPEVGTLRSFGTYFGYGFVHKLPKGHTLKLMPALVYGDSRMGVGLVGRHRSQNSILEAGWATSTENLVVRGRYNIGNGLGIRYGRNAYIPEGFMGARRSGYAAQLEFLRSYQIKDLDLRFNQGFYAGIFSDYQERDQEDAYSTTRFRYTAEIRKKMFEYKNEEQDLKIGVGTLAQAGATVYGSGETFGVVRVGPVLTTKLKRWESSIGYLMAGMHGDSPFNFDKYRYGKSTITLNEKFNFNDKFALGYRAFISPKKDNPEEDLLTESRFYAIFGPQDLKLALSYDFVREVAHLDFMFLVGSKSSRINFDKFYTQNMDGGNRKRDFYKENKSIKIKELENI